MYLNIGEQRVAVDVEFADQIFVRKVEKEINELHRRFRLLFPDNANIEVMAKVAYQYAKFYYELLGRYNAAAAKVKECIQAIDADAQKNDGAVEEGVPS